MQSSYFTAEHQQFRKSVREFLAAEVLPFADEWERRRCIPKELWGKMGRAGLLGLHHSKAVGGAEKDFFHSVVLLEELGRTGYAGFRVAVGVHSYMATSYLAQAGSKELKQKYLAAAVSGEKVSALAITEPEAGSDLNRLRTTAVLDGDSYVINGKKKFVANGTTADFIVLAVKTTPAASAARKGASGVSMLIVDTETAGLSAKRLETLGWHCSDTSELEFNDVRVPASNIIGTANQGFIYIMQCMQLERLAAGLLALGGVDRCLELTWRYMAERPLFDSTLSKLQSVRHRMAELVTEAEATRHLAYHAAWLHERGSLPIAECSMVKLKATELANRAAHECMQFHGAHGYQEASPIARIYRDVQAATIAGGASEVMRDIIAQITLDEAGWRRRNF